ncbi:KamA family protein [Carboxydocella sporoproducens DSM 16521]|uniref:KamA family protein n=2 Tax=Carboxydocella TaxID=178898 RepID=A0A1T4MWM7_9FIRM|nr:MULTISPECIES: hypothetical protein [Carboxydocella]AVX20292.1 KamA family protein [Carboxydocella thermautotrophica]SJZ71373.1 KamA family protein [Carboxydocella sporoproducens DSM 16521]
MERNQKYQQQKSIILKHLQASEAEWQDWRWHLANRISSPLDLAHFLPLTEKEISLLRNASAHRRWAITPHYLAAIDWEQPDDPLKLQVLPWRDKTVAGCPVGLDKKETRYLLTVTNQCAIYCSYCTLTCQQGLIERHLALDLLQSTLNALAQQKKIREIVLVGGDALLLSERRLEWLLREIRKISHIRSVGIVTRTPAVLPQRITAGLCQVLNQSGPINIFTRINHPRELTLATQQALKDLVAAGAIIINQPVAMTIAQRTDLSVAN